MYTPLIALSGVALIAGLVYLPVYLHRHDPPPPSLTRRASDVIVADVPDTTIAGRHNGHLIWRIHAKRVSVAADGHTTTFVSIDHGTLYRNERAAATVSAGKAVYNDDRGVLSISDGLTLTSGGVAARTSRVDWNEKADSIVCPDETILSWNGGFARARTVRTNTRLTAIEAQDVSAASQLEAPVFKRLTQQMGIGASLATFLAAPGAGQNAPPKYKEVRFTHADSLRWDQATDTSTYKGRVSAVQGDTTFSADRIVYSKPTNTAVIYGHIVIVNPKNRVESDTADVDFNAKTAVLKGATGVHVTILPAKKPLPNTLSARIKEPVSLVCTSVKYFYKDKRAEAEGPITVTRPNQVVTGDSGVYTANDEIVTLTGNVHGKDEKNQTFDAPTVKICVKEGAEWMEAPDVKATFFVKDEEQTASSE